jgi:hypothetical protein
VSAYQAHVAQFRRVNLLPALDLRRPAVAIRHGTRRCVASGESGRALRWHRVCTSPDAERRSFAMNELDQRMSSRRATNNKDTGTAETDENYDLVSVLYHCLKAADACTQYIADAEDAGDDELAEFFESARVVQNRLATEARELLAERMSEAGGTSDEES